MFKYQKHNTKRTGGIGHLTKAQTNFTPFSLRDTAYLENLHKELKLRNAREAMVLLRKDMIEANKRSNHQNEFDRIVNELSRPNLPYSTREHLQERIRQMKNIKFA